MELNVVPLCVVTHQYFVFNEEDAELAVDTKQIDYDSTHRRYRADDVFPYFAPIH